MHERDRVCAIGGKEGDGTTKGDEERGEGTEEGWSEQVEGTREEMYERKGGEEEGRGRGGEVWEG